VTPLRNVRTVRGYHHLKFEKEGFGISNDVAMANAVQMQYKLAPKVDIPSEMVLVPPAPKLTQTLSGLPTLDMTGLDAFLVDRYEVTNRQFKAFVEAGGYSNRDYWKEPFTLNGHTVSFEQALARFRDSTGRAGPASWVGATFPEGTDDFPVSGVSWYEAAAYAAFARKSLPSVYHWYRVADPRISVIVAPVSNIGGKRVAKVGQFPNSEPFGAYDVFGNVKEWVFNDAGDGKRFILGGAAHEFAYQATAVDARSPWDRALSNGFRCVRYLKLPAAQYVRPIISEGRDLSREKPVSDEVFAALKRFYSCEPGGLQSSVDGTDNSNEDWRAEKISFQTCYGDERVLAHMYLPKAVRPPYQVIVYQPGTDASLQASSERPSGFGRVDFIIRSGRAVFWPVVKGHYERRYADRPRSVSEIRERAFKPFQDLLRSIEYLQTRPDVLADHIAYAGTSQGANRGIIAVALEPRFRKLILMDGGLYRATLPPELDALNFAPRVKVPVLMVNGRYDFTFPVATSQNPLFHLLGAPESDKRHVLFDSAHDIVLFRTDLIREVLSWLDHYLGPVKR
jgi:formylglycine-generating enzyme required for sulfatase activity